MLHAEAYLPAAVRRQVALDDEILDAELRAIADGHTDLLADVIWDHVHGPKPWVLVSRLPRVRGDRARCSGERDAVHAGMHRTQRLADPVHARRDALADFVDARLEAAGRAVVLGLRSNPQASPPDGLGVRPTTCLRTDAFRTPPALLDAAIRAFEAVGSVAVDEPSRNTGVPPRHHAADRRVSSLTVELRRDAYLHDDGSVDEGALGRVAAAAATVIEWSAR